MNNFFVLLFLGSVFISNIIAQKIDYNTDNGFIASGYDVTEYFNNKAVKGDPKYQTTQDGVSYKFTSQKNLDNFKSSPYKYIPQYGGYCAYAIAINSKKEKINPKTFEVRENKLYLFYNSWGINTLEKWVEKGPEKLKKKADSNWQKIKK
ncbi:YHS domain-containing (seleno)protein [Aquimarina muelleri]|uniref:YHS domain-containing protein n=1 Tax=Aquimarina muelleri TaxID=279356 RepID=A0A918N203_9FLAO|nr:YHS domain-containing (seleno)protein [Aquimarina muelleri]MCX2764237.1 hypothetical protein [Aquimarina muelleri]GGX08175.1 hypothetical protein GCM10007384_07630 [Aquimarina muelleri]